jgi:hypothetical protein
MWLAAALIGLVVGRAGADVDARLIQRLDPATAAAVGQIVESARTAGIPTGPLIATALEGSRKGAPGERIVLAVRRHAAALEASRQALGGESTGPEIEAGAGALMSGVPADSLTRLRSLRPWGSLVVPLVVMADLVTRQVPVATATAALAQASRAGARDADLLRLRARVEADIRRGVAPAEATMARVRGLGLRNPAFAPGGAITDPPGLKRRIVR